MDEETVSFDSSSSGSCDVKTKSKCRQVLTTLAICYICISGGNLVGYTSSAIPSIREGNSSPFMSLLDDELLHTAKSLNESNFVAQVAFRVQEVDQVLEQVESEKVKSRDLSVKEFVELTDSQASWIGGLAPLGAFFGCMLAPLPISFMGPKGTILKLGAPLYLLSWFATSLAPSLVYIYVARIIGGLAMGMTFSSVPIYIMDTASLELRGPLGTFSQFLFTIGVLASFIFGYFFNWRTSAFISGLLVLPVFLILPFIQESPVWIINNCPPSDSECVLNRIQGLSSETQEFQKLQDPTQPTYTKLLNQGPERYRKESFLRSPKAVRSTFIAMFLAIFQQLTGINAVNFYTVTIFEIAAGQKSFLNGHSSAIIVASVFCLANVVSYVLIEKLGRKSLLLISTALLSLSAFSLGTYFFLLENKQVSSHLVFIPLVSLVTFVLAFSIGYGPLLYVIVAEILPSEIRSVVTPVAVGVNWLCVFIVAKTFPGIIHALKAHGAFWMYGTFSCISFLVTVFYVPETKGKSEKEIMSFFEGGSRSRGDKRLKEAETQATHLSLLV